MAFNINAAVVLSGPKNITKVRNSIQKQLSNITVPVKVKLDKSATAGLAGIDKKLSNLNTNLSRLNTTAKSTSRQLTTLASAGKQVSATSTKIGSATSKINKNLKNTANQSKAAASSIRDFGVESAKAIRKFSAFTIATTAVFGFIRSVQQATSEAIKFERELVKITQVTGAAGKQLSGLKKTIDDISTGLGLDANKLLEVSRIFAQTGQSLDQVQKSLKAVSRASLAPTFGDIERTTEGLIAALNQFNISANKSEAILGSLNAVAKKFAVESDDLISVIRRAGGVFAASSQQLGAPEERLRELIGIFTAVRSTTRESADSIATGLRTIFTRIQRPQTIKFLQQFGIQLRATAEDAKRLGIVEGEFIGIFEALKRISQGTRGLDTLSLAKVVEELGGIRQVGKLIPALQNFEKAEKARRVALEGTASISKDVALATQTLSVQIEKLQQRFGKLVRDVSQSATFQSLAKFAISAANAFITLGESLKPIIPLLTAFAGIKIARGAFEFGKGFVGGLKGVGAAGAGKGVSGVLTGQGGAAATANQKQLISSITKNTTALSQNTSALSKLDSSIGTLRQSTSSLNSSSGQLIKESGRLISSISRLSQRISSIPLGGGARPIRKFKDGGFVSGPSHAQGGVVAELEGGEFVVPKKDVKRQKFARGGTVDVKLASRFGAASISDGGGSSVQFVGGIGLEQNPVLENAILRSGKLPGPAKSASGRRTAFNVIGGGTTADKKLLGAINKKINDQTLTSKFKPNAFQKTFLAKSLGKTEAEVGKLTTQQVANSLEGKKLIAQDSGTPAFARLTVSPGLPKEIFRRELVEAGIEDETTAIVKDGFNGIIRGITRSQAFSQVGVRGTPLDPEDGALQSAVNSLINRDPKSARSTIEGYVLEGLISAIAKMPLQGSDASFDFISPAPQDKDGVDDIFGQGAGLRLSKLRAFDAKRTFSKEAARNIVQKKIPKIIQSADIESITQSQAVASGGRIGLNTGGKVGGKKVNVSISDGEGVVPAYFANNNLNLLDRANKGSGPAIDEVARRAPIEKVVGPGTGTSDSIKTTLNDGDFVIRASSVDSLESREQTAASGGRITSGGLKMRGGGVASAAFSAVKRDPTTALLLGFQGSLLASSKSAEEFSANLQSTIFSLLFLGPQIKDFSSTLFAAVKSTKAATDVVGKVNPKDIIQALRLRKSDLPTAKPLPATARTGVGPFGFGGARVGEITSLAQANAKSLKPIVDAANVANKAQTGNIIGQLSNLIRANAKNISPKNVGKVVFKGLGGTVGITALLAGLLGDPIVNAITKGLVGAKKEIQGGIKGFTKEQGGARTAGAAGAAKGALSGAAIGASIGLLLPGGPFTAAILASAGAILGAAKGFAKALQEQAKFDSLSVLNFKADQFGSSLEKLRSTGVENVNALDELKKSADSLNKQFFVTVKRLNALSAPGGVAQAGAGPAGSFVNFLEEAQRRFTGGIEVESTLFGKIEALLDRATESPDRDIGDRGANAITQAILNGLGPLGNVARSIAGLTKISDIGSRAQQTGSLARAIQEVASGELARSRVRARESFASAQQSVQNRTIGLASFTQEDFEGARETSSAIAQSLLSSLPDDELVKIAFRTNQSFDGLIDALKSASNQSVEFKKQLETLESLRATVAISELKKVSDSFNAQIAAAEGFKDQDSVRKLTVLSDIIGTAGQDFVNSINEGVSAEEAKNKATRVFVDQLVEKTVAGVSPDTFSNLFGGKGDAAKLDQARKRLSEAEAAGDQGQIERAKEDLKKLQEQLKTDAVARFNQTIKEAEAGSGAAQRKIELLAQSIQGVDEDTPIATEELKRLIAQFFNLTDAVTEGGVSAEVAEAKNRILAKILAINSSKIDAFALALTKLSTGVSSAVDQFTGALSNVQSSLQNITSTQQNIIPVANRGNVFKNLSGASLQDIEQGVSRVNNDLLGPINTEGVAATIKLGQDLGPALKDTIDELRTQTGSISLQDIEDKLKEKLDFENLSETAKEQLNDFLETTFAGNRQTEISGIAAFEEALRGAGSFEQFVQISEKAAAEFAKVTDGLNALESALLQAANLLVSASREITDAQLKSLDRREQIEDRFSKFTVGGPDPLQQAIQRTRSQVDTALAQGGGPNIAAVGGPQGLLDRRKDLEDQIKALNDSISQGLIPDGTSQKTLLNSDVPKNTKQLAELTSQLEGTKKAIDILANDTRVLSSIENKLTSVQEQRLTQRQRTQAALSRLDSAKTPEERNEALKEIFKPLLAAQKVISGRNITPGEAAVLAQDLANKQGLVATGFRQQEAQRLGIRPEEVSEQSVNEFLEKAAAKLQEGAAGFFTRIAGPIGDFLTGGATGAGATVAGTTGIEQSLLSKQKQILDAQTKLIEESGKRNAELIKNREALLQKALQQTNKKIIESVEEFNKLRESQRELAESARKLNLELKLQTALFDVKQAEKQQKEAQEQFDIAKRNIVGIPSGKDSQAAKNLDEANKNLKEANDRLEKVKKMAEDATTKGSIYTHDTHVELIVKEIAEISKTINDRLGFNIDTQDEILNIAKSSDSTLLAILNVLQSKKDVSGQPFIQQNTTKARPVQVDIVDDVPIVIDRVEPETTKMGPREAEVRKKRAEDQAAARGGSPEIPPEPQPRSTDPTVRDSDSAQPNPLSFQKINGDPSATATGVKSNQQTFEEALSSSITKLSVGERLQKAKIADIKRSGPSKEFLKKQGQEGETPIIPSFTGGPTKLRQKIAAAGNVKGSGQIVNSRGEIVDVPKGTASREEAKNAAFEFLKGESKGVPGFEILGDDLTKPEVPPVPAGPISSDYARLRILDDMKYLPPPPLTPSVPYRPDLLSGRLGKTSVGGATRPPTATTIPKLDGAQGATTLPDGVRQAAQMTINAATVTLNAQNVNFGNNAAANQSPIQLLNQPAANTNAPNMQASMAAMTTFGDKFAQTVQQLNNTTIKIEATNIGPIDVNVNGVEILNTAKTAFMQEFIPVLKQEIASAIQGSANSIDGPTSVGGTNGTMIA